MAIKRIPLSELQRDPVASFKAGAGSPVGVEQDGVVLFFLVSAVDVVTQGLSKPDDPAATPSSPVRTELNPSLQLRRHLDTTQSERSMLTRQQLSPARANQRSRATSNRKGSRRKMRAEHCR